MSPSVALIILTHNALSTITQLLVAVQKQSLQPISILFMDTDSTDGTRDVITLNGFAFYDVKKHKFDHGATRQLATTLVDADIFVFMTQDALFADSEALQNIIATFVCDEKIGCVYGRQLPRPNSTPLEAYARLYNYGEESRIFTYADRFVYGIKTCFNSDSFAAYRKSALREVGGFPQHVIMGEDMCVAAKMLMQGWKVAYNADAKVYHSHHYGVIQEFRRYFTIGVFHQDNLWILQNFSTAYGEGWKFVRSELSYCWSKRAYWSLVRSVISAVVKILGYKLGRCYKCLPIRVRKIFCLSPDYWNMVE